MSLRSELKGLRDKVRRHLDDGHDDGHIVIVPVTPDMTDDEIGAAMGAAAERHRGVETLLVIPDNQRDDHVVTVYPEYSGGDQQ